jgi:hypothetical protein
MSAAKEIVGRAPDQEQEIVGRWIRQRGFGLGLFGEKWWVAPLNREKITPMGMDEIPVIATGMEVIEVLEVADGAAQYRQYLVNPDGELVTVHFAPQYETIWSMPVGRLRGSIKRMKMTHGALAEVPSRSQAVVAPHSADIIAFPAHRIVRRVEHGKGIVALGG